MEYGLLGSLSLADRIESSSYSTGFCAFLQFISESAGRPSIMPCPPMPTVPWVCGPWKGGHQALTTSQHDLIDIYSRYNSTLTS